MGISTGVRRRFGEMSAREIDDLLRLTRETRATQGLPAPGTVDAVLSYQRDEPKPDFLPGEMEALIEDVYAARHEDDRIP